MTWCQTASGLAVDLLHPTQDQISLHDIAVSLGRLPRFNGHTSHGRVWTVAEHSLLCEALLLPNACRQLRLATLLHDAHEAYTGDISTPMKRALASLYSGCGWDLNPLDVIQSRLQSAIHAKVGLPDPLPDEWLVEIKRVDVLALAIEKKELMANPPRDWGELPEPTDVERAKVDWCASCHPRGSFLARLYGLQVEPHMKEAA